MATSQSHRPPLPARLPPSKARHAKAPVSRETGAFSCSIAAIARPVQRTGHMRYRRPKAGPAVRRAALRLFLVSCRSFCGFFFGRIANHGFERADRKRRAFLATGNNRDRAKGHGRLSSGMSVQHTPHRAHGPQRAFASLPIGNNGVRGNRFFRPCQTVAIGVAGEPTAPGRRKGGAVRKKRLRPWARSQSARSFNHQISPKGMPSLNRQ